MKKNFKVIPIIILLGFILPFTLWARDIEPIVSTDWLEKNLNNPKLVVIDIRKVEEYKAGHIPKAANTVYSSWAVVKGGLRNEMPAPDDLSDMLNDAGIGVDSLVVVVGKTDNIPNRTDITRVAWTLKYAGIGNVALLDGGLDKWTADKKPVSTDMTKPKSSSYQVKPNAALFIDKAGVLGSLGKAVIIDVREPDFYQGTKKMDFVAKAGRIKGAVNLPTTQVFTPSGTFKSKTELETLAKGVAGTDMNRPIVVYCDTGKVCTAWAFILTEVLGYANVKIYDGSTEEWMKDQAAPVEP